MVETLQRSGLWHVSLAQRDLIGQAGLHEDDFDYFFTHFTYKDRKVIISHTYDQHLVVSMAGQDDEDMKQLMEGFSKVLEYEPFCKYILNPENEGEHPPLPTYEWDKIDPDARYNELENKSTVSDLVRL